MSNNSLSAHTIAAQAAGFIDRVSGAVTPAIQPAVTYARDRDNALIHPDNFYGRYGVEVTRVAEDLLAKLENAKAAQLHPSGMAAISAIIRALPHGSTLLMQSQIYWGTTLWTRGYAERHGIKLVEAELSDLGVLAESVANHAPDLVFIETPSNPWLRVTDIGESAKIVHKAGGLLVADCTAATPVLTRALDFGADIVMHSATKAINGHSDVLAGVLATNDSDSKLWHSITEDRAVGGAVIGPFEAWLLIRGMRTLPLRIERMSETAQKLANHLNAHPLVEDVFYPGLKNHAGHASAQKQMSAFGGLLSVVVKGGAERALATCGALNLFHRATSLGGVESLVEHRHTIEPNTGIPEGLLRVSVGIEDANDLIADWDQALAC